MQINRNDIPIDIAPLDRRHPVVAGMAERCVEAAGPRDRTKVARTGRRRSANNGRNTPEPVQRRTLDARDFALMAVLGIVHEGFTRFSEIVPAAKSLAGLDWQPTGDVLAGALEDALADGLLVATEAGYALAEEGRLRLAELVQAPPATARGGAGRTAAALKVCFLGALDGETRDLVLDDLTRLQQGQLQALLEGCARCPASGVCARMWIAREIERMRSEIAWLGTLKAELGQTR
jgi:Putative AphA-like transcriptional regulator